MLICKSIERKVEDYLEDWKQYFTIKDLKRPIKIFQEKVSIPVTAIKVLAWNNIFQYRVNLSEKSAAVEQSLDGKVGQIQFRKELKACLMNVF